MGIELAKTNLYISNGPPAGSILLAKTNLYISDDGSPEGPTAELRTPQVRMESVTIIPTGLAASALRGAAVFTFQSQEFQATAANYTIPLDQEKTFQANKASVQVVCRGRPELAYIRAWTFTLDGHDYYVLQLQDITLVYDIHSQQWYNWGSVGRDIWRAQIGIDWNANLGAILGGVIGSTNVIVGDWAQGSLYFLNTGLSEDSGPEGTDLLPYQRLTYGQLPLRGHNYVPCDGVELTGSIGETTGAANQTVTLAYSDDGGHTFVNAGPITVESSQYSFVLQWPSLGSFKGPGRLFKIEDWGVLARIDSIDMNDGEDNG